jgi:hypothetical protein
LRRGIRSRRGICINLSRWRNRADPLSRFLRCVAAGIHAAFISLNAG